jgi:hypothetical protein
MKFKSPIPFDMTVDFRVFAVWLSKMRHKMLVSDRNKYSMARDRQGHMITNNWEDWKGRDVYPDFDGKWIKITWNGKIVFQR